MPLHHIPSCDLPAYVAWFNRHAIDGKLCSAVIKGILEKQGKKPTDTQVQHVIDSLSIDSAGINTQAFLDYVSSYRNLRNPLSEFKAAFMIYDTKGEERLSKSDVTSMFKQMHVDIDVDKLFEEADEDKNGYIDFDEFVTLMSR